MSIEFPAGYRLSHSVTGILGGTCHVRDDRRSYRHYTEFRPSFRDRLRLQALAVWPLLRCSSDRRRCWHIYYWPLL
jgi:hypothetical protein